MTILTLALTPTAASAVAVSPATTRTAFMPGEPVSFGLSVRRDSANEPDGTLRIWAEGDIAGWLTVTPANVVFGPPGAWVGFTVTLDIPAAVAESHLGGFIWVGTPGTGGGTNVGHRVDLYRRPRMFDISPNLAVVGSGDVTLTAKGKDLEPGFTVLWNNQPLATTFVDASTLTAFLPASLVTAASTWAPSPNPPQRIQLSIANGGIASEAFPFDIVQVWAARPSGSQEWTIVSHLAPPEQPPVLSYYLGPTPFDATARASTSDGASWWSVSADNAVWTLTRWSVDFWPLFYHYQWWDEPWALGYSRLSAVPIQGVQVDSVEGLTWDGRRLWLAGRSGSAAVVASLTSSGEITRSVSLPMGFEEEIRGAAWDGSAVAVLAVAGSSSRVMRVSADGDWLGETMLAAGGRSVRGLLADSTTAATLVQTDGLDSLARFRPDGTLIEERPIAPTVDPVSLAGRPARIDVYPCAVAIGSAGDTMVGLQGSASTTSRTVDVHINHQDWVAKYRYYPNAGTLPISIRLSHDAVTWSPWQEVHPAQGFPLPPLSWTLPPSSGVQVVYAQMSYGRFLTPVCSDAIDAQLNRQPFANAGPDVSAEATGPSGATVWLDGTGSWDPDGDDLRFEWTDEAGIVVGTAERLSLTVGLGAHAFTLRVTDAGGAVSQDSSIVTVADTTPPVLTLIVTQIVEAVSRFGAPVEFSAWANDLVDGAVAVNCTPVSGSIFAIQETNVVCSATDLAGNRATSSVTVTVRDTTPPVVHCSPADSLWHGSDVVLTCSAIDAGSGLADDGLKTFTLATNVPAGTETASAATGSQKVCDMAGNCVTVGPFVGIKVDKKAPALLVSAPVAGNLTLHQVLAAAYSCSDGGSGVASCVGTVANGSGVATATPGAKTFTVTANDQVGNQSVQSVAYSVVYGIGVLFDQAKAKQSGSTIPIKIQLQDVNGVNVSAADVAVVAVGISLVSNSAPGPLDDSGNANPDGNFRFAGDSYIFNLKTTGLGTGTYALYFRCGVDPTLHTVQFQIR